MKYRIGNKYKNMEYELNLSFFVFLYELLEEAITLF